MGMASLLRQGRRRRRSRRRPAHRHDRRRGRRIPRRDRPPTHLAPIFLAAPTSPDKPASKPSAKIQPRLRLRHLPRRNHRYPATPSTADAPELVATPAPSSPTLPIAVGFGISNRCPREGGCRVRRRRHHRQRARRINRKNRHPIDAAQSRRQLHQGFTLVPALKRRDFSPATRAR